jgi:type II secretory pathway component GspD/PulD (secretin)
MTLFVAAPDELFREIKRTAEMMDQRPAETIEVYPLKNASATEVLGRFKEMMTQILGQAGGGLGQVFAATADERTNALVVIGSVGTHTAVKQVLDQLDSAPSDATAVTTEMFTLGRGSAASVASTINSLYGRRNWESGMPAPHAAAEGSANVVYVTGTVAQIDHIRKHVMQPLQGLTSEDATTASPLQDYQITVEYADVQNMATTLNQLFQQRFAAQQRAGIVVSPTESTVTIVPEPATRQLLVTCTEKNRELIDTYLATLDVESATDRGQQTKVFRLQFADLGSTAQALTAAFRPAGRVSPSEQVTISAEYATQSLIVKAPADEMTQIETLIAEIDTGDATKMTPPETIRLENARASEVAAMLNSMIQRTKRRDRMTGTFPVSVSAQDDSNTLLVSANSPQDMEEIKGLIKNLDVAPTEDERAVRIYPIQFADLGSVIQSINARFTDNARRPIQDQVAITPDHANNALLVTASEANHERVESIVGKPRQGERGAYARSQDGQARTCTGIRRRPPDERNDSAIQAARPGDGNVPDHGVV